MRFDQIDIGDLDYVVVVGGLLVHSHRIDPGAIPFLHQAYAAGVGLVALCTGFVHPSIEQRVSSLCRPGCPR